jgi:ferredoxin-NADP reductase
LPAAKAGQHLLVSAFDQQGKKVSRAYSLLSDCSQRRYYQLAIKAEPQGRLSQTLFLQLKAGDHLECSWPKGHFTLRQPRLLPLSRRLWPASLRPLVLVAGGIGITPLLAMMFAALRQQRPVQLWYQARTRQDLLFASLLRRLPGLTFVPVLSQPDPEWQGQSGRINAALLLQHVDEKSEFYLCANAQMVAELEQQLRAAGVKHCYHELFSAAHSNENFAIELDGKTVQSLGHSSVLDALLNAGVKVPYDCRGGSCGQCRLTLLGGSCKTVLAPEFAIADNEILSCCMQASSPLQLAFSHTQQHNPSSPVTLLDLKQHTIEIRS